MTNTKLEARDVVRLAGLALCALILCAAGCGERAVVVECSTVQCPPVAPFYEVGPIGIDCPVRDQYHTFYNFNWASDLILSGFGKFDEEDIAWYRVTFRQGLVRIVEEWMRAGEAALVSRYYVDDKGRLSRVVRLCGPPSARPGSAELKPHQELTVEYGEKGLPTRILVGESSRYTDSARIITHQFDSGGRLLSRKATYPNGEPAYTFYGDLAVEEVFRYDENGRLFRSDLLRADGTPPSYKGVPVHVEWNGALGFACRLVDPDGKLVVFEEPPSSFEEPE
jgi:hypothetical protein